MDFGQLISHIATTNYQFCAGLKDSDPPALPSPTEEDAVVKFLSDSFDYCSAVISNLTDAQLGAVSFSAIPSIIVPRSSRISRTRSSAPCTTPPTAAFPAAKFFSPCTSTSPIIPAKPKFISATKAFVLLRIESEQHVSWWLAVLAPFRRN